VSDDLTSTAGIVALAAGGLAIVAIVLVAYLASRLRKVQRNQKVVLGEKGEQDVVSHALLMQSAFDDLQSRVEGAFDQLTKRIGAAEDRLDRAISNAAVVRYDAYNEMSGRQSSSIALLDDTGTGVVMSSILHREQARLYVKGVRDGKPELELSPEENEAIESALSRRSEDGR